MKRICFVIAASLAIAGASLPAHARTFKHPGVFNSAEELDYIRKKMNEPGRNMWKTAFEKVKLGFNSGHVCHQAYANALAWAVTGDQKYADAAISRLNKLTSTTIKCGAGVTGKGHPMACVLGTSMTYAGMVGGAEIIRHYTVDGKSAGWSKADIAKFEKWLINVVWGTLNKWFAPNCGGTKCPGCTYADSPEFKSNPKRASNWESYNSSSRIAIAIFANDEKKFNDGIEKWKWNTQRAIYPNGQIGETRRDCSHATMCLMGTVFGAEAAWQQGIDLYGMDFGMGDKPRVYLGIENKSAINVGNPRPCYPGSGNCKCHSNCAGHYIKDGVAHQGRYWTGTEMAYHHYTNRRGMKMPHAEKVLVDYKLRPSETKGPVPWMTFTHYKLPVNGKAPEARDTADIPGSTSLRDGMEPVSSNWRGFAKESHGVVTDPRGMRINAQERISAGIVITRRPRALSAASVLPVRR